jgi:ubiquinone/menaquinone biosynthesis C-methylase UbiE
MKCVICKSKKLRNVINLGKQPLSGIFYKKKNYKTRKFPLNLLCCSKCNLVQLSKSPNKDKMFGSNYEYRTGLSDLMILHLRSTLKYLENKKYIKNKYSVLDIGSNDGTFLNFFNKQNELVGIDPSLNKFKKFYNKKIIKVYKFFSKKNLSEVLNKDKKFDLITSFAMFYDIVKPAEFCRDIENLLKPNGVWVVEFSYLKLLLENLTYDQICHEHATYYSLKVFKNLIEKEGLRIVDFKLNEINGGSIQIICSKNSSKYKSNTKKIIRTIEAEKNINSQCFERFKERVKKNKKLIQNFFNLNSKKKVIGYGASTKGNIIINYCGIKNNNLKMICDANIEKINKFTPGSNIRVISKKMMRKLKPDYLFVLIWSFKKEVIKQELNYIKTGGILVFPLPKFHLVNIHNYKFYLKKKINLLSFKI